MFNKPPADHAAERIEQAALSAEAALAATRQLASEAMDGLAGSVDGLRSHTAPALGRLADQAGTLTQDGIDAVRHGSQRLAERARLATDGTTHYIRHEPLKAMLMAAATGAALLALIQLVTGRRGRD